MQQDSLEVFVDGAKIYKKSKGESPLRYIKQQAINRAYRRYVENEYNLVINNCESFVRWCTAGGEHRTLLKKVRT